MIQLYNMKALRLVNSIFSCTFASEPKSFVLVGPKPSNFCLPNQLLCRPINAEISETQHGFKVNYLINTYGLSPEDAISKSVLALLRNHGLSQTQISKLVRSRPPIISANPEKTLLPKLEFVSSLRGWTLQKLWLIIHIFWDKLDKQDYAHL
ncbi:unnamed protein product [Malus baccata var. baccata]